MKIAQEIFSKNKGELWFLEGEFTTTRPENCWVFQQPNNKSYKYDYLYLLTQKNLAKSLEGTPNYASLQEKQEKFEVHWGVCKQVGIKIDRENIFKAIPEKIIREYLSVKELCLRNMIPEQIPESYHWLKRMYLFSQFLNRKLTLLEENSVRTYKFHYDVFGTVTGRWLVRSKEATFYNWPKEKRKIIVPKNDYLVEFDFNGMDIRSLLALGHKEQPQIDIHSWHMKQFNWQDRKESKKLFFQWLYSKRDSNEISQIYKRNIWKEYEEENKITNPFKRELPSIKDKELNYLVQSTSFDILIEQSMALYKSLVKMESYISFLFYDCVVLDVTENELENVLQMSKDFGKTRFGNFLVNIKVGKNYGEMNETVSVNR